MRGTLTTITCLALSLVSTSALAESQSVGFSQVKGWDIDATFSKEDQSFLFCSGVRLHPDDTYFYIGLDRDRNWSLHLFNRKWAGQAGSKFRVDLYVDGRLVDSNTARWLQSGTGAEIDFGNSLSSMKALMLGNVLTIVSNYGQSAFSLFGSYAAALKVAECYDNQQRMAPSGGGAFSSAGAPAAQGGNNNTRIASRADTLEVATAYLGNSVVPYKILPEGSNQIDAMPVNWTYGKSSVGGMMIFLDSPTTSEEALTIFLKEQAGVCSGKTAIDRKPARTTKDGTVSMAEGMCQTTEDTFSASWKVAKVGNHVMVVMELVDLSDAEANSSLKEDRQFGGGLLSSFPAR